MKKLIFLLSCILLVLCSFLFGCEKRPKNEYIPARYVVLAQETRAKIGQQLAKQYNMHLTGTGGGLSKCVNILILYFRLQGPKNQDELREILVDCVEIFLADLNANEELRPTLSHYPFTAKGLEISLSLVDESNRPICAPNLTAAIAADSKIYYFSIDDSKLIGGNEIVNIEDYKEAKQIVQNSRR